jgi:hypothetical protein
MSFLNKALWMRIALIASGVWLGGVIIISANSRNFEWVYQYQRGLGPAAITAIVGVAVIWVVCLGVPWIAEVTSKTEDH